MKTNFFATKNLPPYVFEAIFELKTKVRARGLEIIDFGMGNPDLAPPKFAMEKLAKLALDPTLYGYSVVGGIKELKKACVSYYKRRFGVEIDENSEIVSSIGAKEGLTSLATAISGEDDYFVVADPSYPIHSFAFLIAKNKVRKIKAIAPTDFLAKFKDLVENCEKKPLAVLVNYPSNPTTQIVGLDFYQDLVDFCKKHGIYIISDIAYCEIYFGEENKPPSILEIEGAKDIAIEFSSVSKSFGLAGARIGFAVGNRNLVRELHKIKSYLDYGSFSPVQMIAAECFDNAGCDDYLQNLRETYGKRAKILVDLLKTELNWDCEMPKAAMFIFAKIPAKFAKLGSFGFCKKLLEETGVVLSPGNGFGDNGEGFVRFSLIHDEEKMREAVAKMKKFFVAD